MAQPLFNTGKMYTKIQSTNFRLLFILLGGVCIAGLLQYRYVFHVFFLEQFQLFLSGKEYAREILSQPGGLTEYLSEYCIQFFNINYVGTICTTIFLLLIGLTLHLLLITNRKEEYFVFVSESAILFFLFMNFLDIGFYYRGIMGYLFCVAALLIYRQMQTFPFPKRLFFGFLLVLFLFWIAAPFQTLFLIAASCIELRENGLNKGKSLLPLLVAGISGYLVYTFLGNGVYRMYVDLDGICFLLIIPGWTKYAAWVLLPIAILLTPLLERLVKSIKNTHLTISLQALIIIAALIFLLPRYDDNWSLPFKRLNQYATQERWDDILDYCKKHTLEDYSCLNYQNLALAKKGLLADSLLAYQQKGVYGLFSPWDRTVYAALTLQQVCYHYGDIASAQRYAFEGNVSSVTMGFPETMKILVRTNMLQGEYRVAAKYIHYLRQTFSYKEWTDKQCHYLSYPETIETDPAYKGKRKYLQKEDHLILQNDLYMLAELDKEDNQLRDFVLCSYLLSKDLKGFLKKFDSYYKETDPEKIPTIYYEAIMACVPNSPDVLSHYQIPENIKDNFEMYASIYSRAQNPEERKKRLSLYHATSYWFYFHFGETKL